MSILAATYCTREEVKTALRVAETARTNDQIDRAIESARDDVDRLLRRRFTPWTGTRYFDWPDRAQGTAYRLWLGADELAADATAVVSGGVTLAPGDWLAEPVNAGPPYTHLDINLATSAALSAGDNWQRAIAITGPFGYRLDEEPVGELAGTLAASASATASVTWTTPRVGVGDLLRVDSERVLVTERTMVDSGQNLLANLGSSTATVSFAVTDGTAFAVETTLMVDAERMRIVDIAGNTLVVKRAWDGSVLAAHTTGADIYTLTGVTLARARGGTTLAAHSSGADIYSHVNPAAVRDLSLAYALNQVLQEQAGYARTAGSGENEREVSGRGIAGKERAGLERHGRQILHGAI
jgi:hypothetical protein